MNVIQHNPYYLASKPSVDEAVDAKMKVLEEFYIVDKMNYDEIKSQLLEAIKSQPGKDYELVLDRVAHTLIAAKLNDL